MEEGGEGVLSPTAMLLMPLPDGDQCQCGADGMLRPDAHDLPLDSGVSPTWLDKGIPVQPCVSCIDKAEHLRITLHSDFWTRYRG